MKFIFTKMANKNCFAKIDCSAAYWQVELDNKSKEITTINTPNGLYQFNRLPYGIKTAPAIFQNIPESNGKINWKFGWNYCCTG